MNFRNIEITDKPIFDRFVKGTKNPRSLYNFTTCYIWAGDDKVKIAIDDDVLYILWNLKEKSFMLYPIVLGGDVKAAIDKGVSHLESLSAKPRFISLSPNDVLELKSVYPDDFHYDYDRDNSDYLYETERLINLSGKKLHSKKNHYNAFCKNYNFTYRRIEKDDIDACKELFDLWYKDKDEDTRLLKESKDATFKLLDNLDELGVTGGLIEVDGKIIACSVGEKITDDTALIHVEFANTEYRGAYAAINREFAKNEWADCKFINREEDMGDEGLRKAKESYQPVTLLDEYRATLK